jgi:hypothetical protein
MGTKNKTADERCLETLSILFNTKIKELPKGFYTSVKIGDYYMYVRTMHTVPPVVYVEKKDGCGMTTTIKFNDPNPDLTVGELFKRAKELIETSVNCSGQ